ncbi:MAG: DUF1385 domain-containing protein [Chloroflexi bacterium]|nr:DUF1385 domain-containing protein [Chloroflexota bacterium]MQC26974.1 DUF1385 domain-containing protein [Chloroflexota bacterium]
MADQAPPLYGGQAVIEGVMMRGSKAMSVAMRAPDGKIVLHNESLGPIYQSRAAKIPFLRGLVLLWDALVLGTRVLALSANVQAEEEDERIEGGALTLTILGSLAIAVILFFLTPAGISLLAEQYLHLPANWGNIVEGVVRLGILIGYLLLIGRMDDIRRVFGYHGAEHKTINAYEAGATLTPETVDQFPLEHPRCGTAFLLTVVVFSILLFSLLGPMPLLPRLGLRVLLIPALASLAYEYLRWTARNIASPIVRLLVAPNLALQRLTTRPPDKAMLEVAIAAFEDVRAKELLLREAAS